jgi:glycosyltransferase involved in cell wall biosynthesis
MRDMIEDGTSGLLVRPGDSRSLASAMSRVLADDKLRASLGAGGKERVVRFTASTVVEQLEQVYANVAAPFRGIEGATVGPQGSVSHSRAQLLGETS